MDDSLRKKKFPFFLKNLGPGGKIGTFVEPFWDFGLNQHQIWELTGSTALSLRHPNGKASRMSPCVMVFIDDYSSYQEMLLL